MINRFFISGGAAKELEEKLALFEGSDFNYNFDGDIFVNQKNLTIVSMEYIQDNPLESLKNLFLPSKTPRVYLSDETISQEIKGALIRNFLPRHNN